MNEKKSLGIKETTEALDALNILAEAGGKIAADSKVDMSDLQHLVGVFNNFKKLTDGIEDAKLAIDEMKDIDTAEATIIVAKVFEIIKTFKAASGK